jgi:starvation-inducible DNA-binding protein
MESLSGERLKHVADNDAEYVQPLDMIGELREDNQALVARMIEIHDQCEKANDIATASFLENWIDQAQRWVWFLFETARTGVAA